CVPKSHEEDFLTLLLLLHGNTPQACLARERCRAVAAAAEQLRGSFQLYFTVDAKRAQKKLLFFDTEDTATVLSNTREVSDPIMDVYLCNWPEADKEDFIMDGEEVPAALVFPLRRWFLDGLSVWSMRNIHGLLDTRYGRTWQSNCRSPNWRSAQKRTSSRPWPKKLPCSALDVFFPRVELEVEAPQVPQLRAGLAAWACDLWSSLDEESRPTAELCALEPEGSQEAEALVSAGRVNHYLLGLELIWPDLYCEAMVLLWPAPQPVRHSDTTVILSLSSPGNPAVPEAALEVESFTCFRLPVRAWDTPLWDVEKRHLAPRAARRAAAALRRVLFVVAFILLVLLFKAPYCYATNVLPGTGFQWLRNRSFLLLLVSEVFNSLSCYAAQDVPQWLTLNGWKVSEIEILVLIVAASLPLLLHLSFRALRRMQVWGPWALRDFACCLPAGTLLRAIAMHNSGGQSRSKIFLAALALSVLVDAMRYTAILSAMMTVLGSKWNALKGCYLAACLSAAAAAASPWVSQWVAQQISGISLDLEEEVLPDDPAALGKATISAVLPLALTGYVFQVAAAFFFNQEVLTFKAPLQAAPEGSPEAISATAASFRTDLETYQVVLGGKGAETYGCGEGCIEQAQGDVSRAEELALDQVQAAIEESFMREPSESTSRPTLLSPKGGAKHWDSSPKSVMPMEEEEGEEEVPNERNDIMNARQLLAKGAEAEKWTSGAEKDATTKSVASFDVQTEMVTPSHEEESCAEDKEQEAEPWTSGMPDKDATTTKSVASFDVQMEIVTPDEEMSPCTWSRVHQKRMRRMRKMRTRYQWSWRPCLARRTPVSPGRDAERDLANGKALTLELVAHRQERRRITRAAGARC
ncbi:unnamed protein product, partial [Effrenium voratum]